MLGGYASKNNPRIDRKGTVSYQGSDKIQGWKRVQRRTEEGGTKGSSIYLVYILLVV
jgi:hypothetical protein